MPRRQPFDEFLNGGPSSPRGRGGRGRGGGGRGGFPGRGTPLGGGENARGAFRGGARGGRGRTFGSDYSNVGFDYASIQKQGYSKLEGYRVQPNEAASSSDTFRGGGRGRGRGFDGPRPPYTLRGGAPRGGYTGRGNFTPSGAATPVTGLGYQGKGKEPARGERALGKSTVGKGGVVWGGGMAPLFIKAGELFKEGEVDIISLDQNEQVHIDVLPLSDPSAPQMTDLKDDTELEIQWPQAAVFPSTSPDPADDEFTQEQDPIHVTGHRVADFLARGSSPPPDSESIPDGISEMGPANEETETAADQDSAVTARAVIEVEEEISLFFVDTAPTADETVLAAYERMEGATLGEDRPEMAVTEDENIVFTPKTYREPEPITIPVPLPPLDHAHRDSWTVTRADEELIFRAQARRNKKAAKREKRQQRGRRPQKAKRQSEPIHGSDLEWGSDGPPPAVMDVDGLEELDDDADDDVAVLRDYLAGTLLNAKDEDEEEEEEEGDGEDAGSGMNPTSVADGAGETGVIDELSEGEEENQWESDSGSASGSIDSSDLDDLEAALVLDSEEDDDYDALFNGKSGKGKGKAAVQGKGRAKWSEEDEGEDDGDWFIRHMEAALNGNELPASERKVREQLFESIHNGAFVEDWDLATQPAKKGKKKDRLKGIPAELKAQWESDRQKKAAKRTQRDIELGRLVADIERHMPEFSRSRSAKRQTKARAASYAHLIPASASEVADMFDIDSDDSDDCLPASSLPYHLQKVGKRNKKAKTLGLLPRSMAELDLEVKAFLEDPGRSSYACPPMPKTERAKVHLLANCYGLGSKSRGNGHDRFTVLIKTSRTGQNIDQPKLDRILGASHLAGGGFYKAVYARGGGGKGDKRDKPRGAKKHGPPEASVRHRDGDLVGHGAERIGEGNVGHRLLKMMGWEEGDRIGKTEGGLEQPIIAVVKNTKTGLGA